MPSWCSFVLGRGSSWDARSSRQRPPGLSAKRRSGGIQGALLPGRGGGAGPGSSAPWIPPDLRLADSPGGRC
ncbi:hypothetical protein C5C13_03160, partial [Clavibacter michiganensis]